MNKITKLLLLLVCLLWLPSFGLAQGLQGEFWLVGEAQFSHQQFRLDTLDFRSNVTNFGLSPRATYFFVDQIAIGLAFPFGYTSIGSGDDIRTSQFRFGLVPEFTFVPSKGPIRPLIRVGYYTGWVASWGDLADQMNSSGLGPPSYGPNVDLGILYFYKENRALEISLKGSYRWFELGDRDFIYLGSGTDFSVGLGLGLWFGQTSKS